MESRETVLPERPRPSAGARRRISTPADAHAGAPDRPGELLLGRYLLLEPIGSGGFGQVWRARDESLQREVAVKRIHAPDGEGGERAVREAMAAARLSHPAIVALYEACEIDGSVYLISELVEGHTLARLIARDRLEDEDVAEIGLALCGALEHAHSRGVIHRDVKPLNVLVPDHPSGPAGAAKLTDFGGARLAGEQTLTRTGDVLGTLAYMAPEQSAGREAGPPADLYSLALVLYEAYAGENPVRGATPAATARRIGSRLPPLRRARPDLPRQLGRAIDRALEADPRRRGDLAALAQALHAELDELGGARPREPGPAAGDGERDEFEQADARAPARAWDAAAGLEDHDGDTREARGAPRPTSGARLPRPPGPPAYAAAGPGVPAQWPAAAPGQAPAQGVEDEQAGERTGRRAILPRTAWVAAGLALVAWQAIAGRPGVALLLAAALLPLLALPSRSGPGWLLALLAPVLGTIGLAEAYPAIAGQPRGWRARAGLGALGYWWVVLAEPLLSRDLWLGPAASVPAHAAWETSAGSAASHVIGPLLSTGVLLGLLLWAAGAALLPVFVRGHSALLDVGGACLWAAALAFAAPRAAAGLPAPAFEPTPRGLVLGAVAGAAVAVAARAVRGPL